MKSLFIYIFIIFISVPLFADSTVIAEGMAQIKNNNLVMARDEAIIDAKNNAVEIAVGSFVSRDAIASNQKVIADLILTKSNGFISDWNVIEGSEKVTEFEGIKVLKLKINAHVRKASIFSDLKNVKALYDAVKKPRFGVLSKNELVRTRIIDKLKNYGFNVVAVDSVSQKDKAEVFVLIDADKEVKAKEKSNLPGLSDMFVSKSYLDVKFIYGNTGEYIFNLKKPVVGEGKSFLSMNEAEIKAFNDACNILFDRYAERFNESIIDRWINELNGGKRYFLYFEGLTYGDFQKALDDIKDQRYFLDMLYENYESGKAYVEVYFKADNKYMADMLKNIKIGRKSPQVSKYNNSDKKFLLKSP